MNGSATLKVTRCRRSGGRVCSSQETRCPWNVYATAKPAPTVRIVITSLTVGAGFAVAYTFHGHLVSWLEQTLPPERRHLVTFSVAEPFITSMWVSLYAGL